MRCVSYFRQDPINAYFIVGFDVSSSVLSLFTVMILEKTCTPSDIIIRIQFDKIHGVFLTQKGEKLKGYAKCQTKMLLLHYFLIFFYEGLTNIINGNLSAKIHVILWLRILGILCFSFFTNYWVLVMLNCENGEKPWTIWSRAFLNFLFLSFHFAICLILLLLFWQ